MLASAQVADVFLGESMTLRLALTLWMVVVASVAARAQDVPKRYLIAFTPDTTDAQKALTVGSLGGSEEGSIDELGLMVADVVDPARVQSLDARQMTDLRIARIEEDVYRNWLAGAQAPLLSLPELPTWQSIRAAIPRFSRRDAVPLSPVPDGISAVEVPWGVRRVDAPAAWPVTQGEGVRVAVVDTGIDAAHPDLSGQVAGGYNAIEPGQPYFDDNSHGTHVSGTIAARLDGRGVVGVAPGASLYAVKVLDKNGGGGIVSIIRGLVWCARNRMQVANMSLSAPVGSIFLRLAVQYAASHGVTLVAAAGNSGGSVQYPAAYDGVIAVAASDDRDQLASFSSRGPKVAFIAPGVDVNSTVLDGRYATYSGTSMATPHVSGLAALAISRGASTPAQVEAALESAASPLALTAEQQGHGMIDAARLLQ